jgi:hypothetical protein
VTIQGHPGVLHEISSRSSDRPPCGVALLPQAIEAAGAAGSAAAG